MSPLSRFANRWVHSSCAWRKHMEHSWHGEVIFSQAMQGSLSNAPIAVSSSSLLSCQARTRNLLGGIAGLCAPFVRTIFTPAHGSKIWQSPDTMFFAQTLGIFVRAAFTAGQCNRTSCKSFASSSTSSSSDARRASSLHDWHAHHLRFAAIAAA